MPPLFGLVFAGAFGAIVGSFLNVCIHRLPLGGSIVWPSSACPHCKRELPWYENIPVASWLVLRARCRTCKNPISIRYPFVEALTCAMFVGAWWYYGPGPLLASRLVLGCLLIVLFAIDLEHHLLPNVITSAGHRGGSCVQSHHRARLDRFTHWPGGWVRRAVFCGAWPISGSGARKASAWAIRRCSP